ncbi:hypothetical protein TKK_0006582 [Trichogramma kaykai]|uniref:Large ribosomal subunit protein uL24m n=1 Tax=Trichogramma kaykai TaxID=54128 RepID=A0ABD2XCR3_9HYME
MPRFNILKLVGEHSKRFANLPDRYIKRSMERIYWKTPGPPKYLARTHEKKVFKFDMHRPWTNEFKLENPDGQIPEKIHVEPVLHWPFYRGDRVEIMVGPDKGKQGIVKIIYEERNWVIVEGLNTVLEMMGKTKDFPGMPIRKEMPLLITTDVQHVDPTDLKPTKIEWRYTEEGELVRVSVRTGRIIPVPPSHYETIDYKTPESYVEGDKDTIKAEVQKMTYEPNLKTFDMDLKDKLGIVENRVRKKTYWY